MMAAEQIATAHFCIAVAEMTMEIASPHSNRHPRELQLLSETDPADAVELQEVAT